MTDADNDGSHIKGLILNMIHYFWPSLLELGFVVSMVTPIIKATKGTQSHSFYTESTFRRWYQTNTNGWKIKYYKGLGTSTSVEAREYFKNLEKLTVRFNADEDTKNSIVLAFDKTQADARKTWLMANSDKSPEDREVPYGTIKELDIHDFIHRDLVNFSMADVRRSIAHMCDGLKPSQRKVIYACFAKNLVKDEMKVAQLAAYVSEKTSYHHGEVSLADTIVKIAQNFVGSNNINFLEPCGQFGTRLMGGKDASQTRYIFTKLTPEARTLFHTDDDNVLTYLTDDGKLIEPEFFMPVLPTVLINGTEGIGTGFSCYVPPYNPEDIKANIKRALNNEPLMTMAPWFKGFKGTVKTSDDGVAWLAQGCWSGNSTKYTITELPPGRWTQDFKEHLDILLDKKTITNYINHSTPDDVKFEVFGYTGSDIVKDLKLQKTIHTTNMHLFHPKTGIKKYKSAEDILLDFIELRLQYYKLRKQHLIDSLTVTQNTVENKARFVKMVVDEELIIFKRKKAELEEEMEKVHKFDKGSGGTTYDYLLGIKTYQYTEEAIEKLTMEAEEIRQKLAKLKKTTIVNMWLGDLGTVN
jgi:DNA topoisomerase-2